MVRESTLAPGFRFHPTDEELVCYYLKRKILNLPCFDAISVTDIYKAEPWDLPDKSKLKSRDLEWYFFSVLDKKYGNGFRTNRATDRGYWKTTGKDRQIHHKQRVAGMKKTLVYHIGRAPNGERTNWVMHEYRLTDEELVNAGSHQDAFVLCRIFQKSGSGPKNGEQYGAPFIEEEWEDDEAVFVPGQLAVTVDEEVVNDAYVGTINIDQNYNIGNPTVSNHAEYPREFDEDYQNTPGNISENAFVSSNFYYGEPSIVENSRDFDEDNQKFIGMHTGGNNSEPYHEHVASDLPEQIEMLSNGRPIKDENMLKPVEPVNPADSNYFLHEPWPEFAECPPGNDGFLLADLSNPIDPESDFFDIDEFLTFDGVDDQPPPPAFGIDELRDGETTVCEQMPLVQMNLNGETQQMADASKSVNQEQHVNNDASSSKQELEAIKSESDTKHPLIKHASHLLGSFPAPPAFASEFPSKDVALKLNSAAQASDSVRVMAGMIRITDVTTSGNHLGWSSNKNGNVNIVVSFSLPQGGSLLSGKAGSAMSRWWFFLMFFWVLLIAVVFKASSCIRSR